MKKILILNGSQRLKGTYTLLKIIEKKFDKYTVEFVNIKDYDLKPCIGCENCLRKGTCNINDEAHQLLDKLVSADGIVIGTPVYLRQLPGYLKVLFDRACSWYHRSPLVGKPIMFVVTTQVTGLKQVINQLKDLSLQWGTIYCGNISRKIFNIEDKLDDKSLKSFKYYLEDKNKKNYKPSIKQITEFNTQKVLSECILPIDLEHWTEKGYIGKPYFYGCKINVFKRSLGYLYYKMLSYFIDKNKIV